MRDMTKLTLSMIRRFYSEDPPAFVESMARSLKESGQRLRRLPGTSMFYRNTDRQYQEDIKLQHHIADEVSRDGFRPLHLTLTISYAATYRNRSFRTASNIRPITRIF